MTVNAAGPGFVDTELSEGVGNELLHAVPRARHLVSEETSCSNGTAHDNHGG